MENPTLEQVFEILDKQFNKAFGRDNVQIMEVINDIKEELLEIAQN